MSHPNFSQEDSARVRGDWEAWWAGELSRPLVYLAVTDPLPAEPVRYSFLSNYPMTMPATELVELNAPQVNATHYYGDAFPWWWVNFGPGIASGFMGAQVHSVAEPSETVWFTPSRETALPELTLAHTQDSVWWRRVADITRAIVERWDGAVQVGHTDLGGNLDILASFRTSEGLLYDVIDHPEDVVRCVAEITAAWIRYYGELDALIRPACGGTSCWTSLWSPGKTYMLQCDFSYMISPRMFERFVMPDLVACCAYLDHAFYHLDGKGEIPHLPLLLSIERLRGIQWIPGDGQPPANEWLPLLKRIRDGGKLCQVYVSPEGALQIARALGGRGFLFIVQHSNGEFRDPERARAFVKELTAL